MSNVLIAGGTGYLGRHVIEELLKAGVSTRAIARKVSKLAQYQNKGLDIIEAEVTKPNTLTNVMAGVDTVISTVGITRQKDGLTYEQVDYQANLNLLRAAQANGVRKFIFVSVLNGENLRHLKICKAKEQFVDELKSSGLDYTVIRPNGFFSDMKEFIEMAKKGSIYLFGDGLTKSNPIHGRDLAKVCVQAIGDGATEIKVGGPDTITQLELTRLAFDAINKPVSVVKIPDIFRRIAVSVLRIFTPVSVYGPLEFFLTVLSMDMLAPEVGEEHLGDFFRTLVADQNPPEGDRKFSEVNSHG